jgi:hypothetical protein
MSRFKKPGVKIAIGGAVVLVIAGVFAGETLVSFGERTGERYHDGGYRKTG